MEDYRLDQSGQEVQEILNGAAMQVDLTEETERATEAEQTLQGNIDAEATRAQGAEGTLQDNIDAEETRAKAAEKQNADDIDAIEEKIPSGASSLNKLATEEYVADAVATATATFRGTYNLVSDLHLNVTATEQQIAAALAGAISTADNNDYCFIQVPTSLETPTEIKEIDRYKFNGTAWAFEYKLNNSGFTAAQWAAINSGITSGDVAKLAALPTNEQLTTLLAGLQSDIDGEEARAKGAEGTLQDNIDAEEARAKAAEKQNADDIDAIEAVIPESASSENKVATKSEIDSLSAAIEAILLLIPSAATSLNKLADKAFVNSSIATATATFRGTYNLVVDLGLTISATHAQIATALAGAILTADNNDYAFVQIPTSDAMPSEIAQTDRYKFNGTSWDYEYTLNNSGYTAAQWAAINSGITAALVSKLNGLPTADALQLALNAITQDIDNLEAVVPTEATSSNQLADKAFVLNEILLATPAFKGQFTTLTQLQAVTGAKTGDIGIVRTKDNDGKDVFTFYQYKDDKWTYFYSLSYHPQDKPATTGIIGSYPFNGMGRVELPMNLVDGWPNDTWLYLPVNGVVYLLYSWNLQLYAVYNSGSQEGLGLENNIVIEPASYNIADIAELVGSRYLLYTEAGGVFTITKPDTTTITSTVLNNTTIYKEDDTDHHGINLLTQSMLNRPNTVYVIQYDFTLGEDITVPANCVLEFDGGNIKGANNTLTLQDTFIDAPNIAIFDNVIFSGTITNGMFNAIWIKGTDIGQSVNIAATYFKKICLPANEYIFTTPMLLDHCQYVNLLGVYKYNGVLTNGMAVVRFNECRAAYLKFGDLRLTDAVIAQMSYADNRAKNIIGVNLDNSGNTYLFVKTVTGFNEGIRVSATETNGGDCFIEAVTLSKNNIGVRIYQQNGPNYTPRTNVQFVNDTNIRVNYCNATSSVTGTKYGVVVAGPAFDNVSYKDPDVVDSYDYCSGVVIEGGDYENATIGFYCRNCEISIQNAREENMTTFVKAVGSLKLNYLPKYTNSIGKIDFSECTNFIPNGLPYVSFRANYNINIQVYKFAGYSYVCPFNYYILKENDGVIPAANKLLYSNVVGVGVIVNNPLGSGIINVKTTKKIGYKVAYLDSDNNNISANYNKPNDGYYLQYGSYASSITKYNETLVIPNGVSKVFIGIAWGTESSPNKDIITIEAYNNNGVDGFKVDNNPIVLSGTTRPSALPKDVLFFDETLGKPIWWNGTNWVDATGASV